MKKAALIVSIIGLITWIFPPVGFAVSWVGMIMGFMAQKDPDSKMAKASAILGIMGLVLCLMNIFAGIAIK